MVFKIRVIVYIYINRGNCFIIDVVQQFYRDLKNDTPKSVLVISKKICFILRHVSLIL